MTGTEGKDLVLRVVKAISNILQAHEGTVKDDLKVILGGVEELYVDNGALESRLEIYKDLHQRLRENLCKTTPPDARTYAEKLNDPRWIAKRDHIRERDGGKCVQDGEAGEIHVHHSHYRAGREPWQYRDSDLFTLCKKCHEKNHGVGLEVEA